MIVQLSLTEFNLKDVQSSYRAFVATGVVVHGVHHDVHGVRAHHRFIYCVTTICAVR
jgi:hypothetical protein